MTTTESPSKPKRSPKAKKNGAAPAPAPEETSLPDASAKVLEEQPPSPAVRQEAMPGTEPPPRHGSAEEGDVLSLTIEATALARVLGQVKGATQKKTTMPVLANVLLRTREDGRLEVAATDLELSLVTSTPAEIRRHGSLSIACRTLYEIVRGLPKEQVHLQADRKNWIEIRCGRSRYRIAGMAADGFPQIGDAGGDRRAVDAGALREMIDRTAYAICKDSQRYNLCGLFFQGLPGGKTAGGDEVNPGLRAVSTDGHRLALADARWSSAPEVPTVTIPAKGIEEIRKLLTEGDDAIVRLGISENHIVVERGDIRLVCQLVEGQFPEYQQVIPDPEKRTSAITVDRQALRDALKRVEALTASKGQGARLTCRGPALSITAVAVDVGEFEEELACELTGKAQAVGVNVSFLLESVETFEEERVTLHVIDALAPLVVVGAEDQGRELQAVVMPMRM